MVIERTCPQCGTNLSSDALEGLCPTCVGRAAFASAGASEITPEIEAEFARLKPEEAGEQIGQYKLMEQIGQGGFGTVWVADQEKPVRRRVALKIIKLGMDTKEVIARFEQERQALAIMDHPHIAKVFDAGATQWGRPFFVMELVRGIKITDYCDQANLPTTERLQLFIQVCQAVQHAHQKGIIHRDLKPSNILVTLHDGVPVPKVIDFGVAKATQQQRLGDQTVYTQFQQMIGTPLYMSPEQAEMSGIDIDTRCDIYSLGVLLYELLTGHTPFDPGELMRKAHDEIRRVIREQEPRTPSQFIHTMAADLRATVAQRRQSDPGRLFSLLRGDLDWIVMKALEKDRTRRYETANGLAKDIERHLANEPVTARPASPLYRFRLLVRRNRVVFAATGAVTAALIAGFAVAVWQAQRASREAKLSAAALDELRATAPAFAEQARALAAKEQFTEAIDKLDYALKLRPDAAEYLVVKGDLLQCQFKLAEAAATYREALRVQPVLARAEDSAKLCDELLAADPGEHGKLTRESLAKLHLAMQQQQRPASHLMPVARLLGEEKKLIVDYWLARLKDLPVSAEKSLKDRLNVREDGRLALDLSGTKIVDLSPLAGAPLGGLSVAGSSELVDLSPLRGMDLVALDISQTSVADLAPLNGMHPLKNLNLAQSKVTNLAALSALQLEDLDLEGMRIFDLTALRGMKLTQLNLRGTRVADLSPLAGMPLTYFDATEIPATDYSPLAGAPLEKCWVQRTPVRDLSFLRGSPVKELSLEGCNELRGYSVLASLKSLSLLILPLSIRNLPAEELAAIGALRTHPALRNIEAPNRTRGNWSFNTTQSKEDFWEGWDLEESLLASLRKAGLKFTLEKLPDGTFSLTMANQPLRDLALLKDAPISKLRIDAMPVSDLTALKSPTLSNSLKHLYLWRIDATDFSPVAACRNLVVFQAPDTKVSSIEFLRGLKLSKLQLNSTKVTDLSPLGGLPLETLILNHTAVTELTPLLQCPTLKALILPTKPRDLQALRQLPALAAIDYFEKSGGIIRPAADFWKTEGLAEKALPSLVADTAKDPSNTVLALKVAALQVWFGRHAEYTATVRRQFAWIETSSEIDNAERTAKLSCLDATADAPIREAALRLARKVVELGKDSRTVGPWSSMTLGMAEYRNAHYPEAIQNLTAAEDAIRSSSNEQYRAWISGTAGFFRAMSHFQQGRTAEARALFTTTEATAKHGPADVSTLWDGVNHDDLVLWLAYKEAKTLLQPQPQTVPASPDGK